MTPPNHNPKPPSGDQEFRREQDRIDVKALHDPIMREMSEPSDGYEPVPIGLILVFFGLLAWGGWYLGTYSGGWDPNNYSENPRALAAGAAPAKPLDPVALGQRVYNSCRTCHQSNGAGTLGNYPPLAGSELVQGDPETLARIVLGGLEGPITVKGKNFNNVMPPWRALLSDEQVANVLTYVRQAWGNKAPPVEVALVGRIRKETAERRSAWTWIELDQARKAVPAKPVTASGGPKGAGK